jgi:AcrR family transcriptional regulator
MAPKARTAPRKKPQQERSRATIDAILTATTRILVRDGFDHASTNRIAEAAGVSIGSLYQYFPSKEALVAALVERHIEEMTREIVVAMDEVAALPLAGGVRAVVDLMLRAHAVDPLLHKVLVEQVPRTGRLEHIHDIERRMMDLVRGYLQAHAPELRVRDLELAAFVVVTSVEALTHAATIHHADRMAGRALADEITDLVVRYLGK